MFTFQKAYFFTLSPPPPLHKGGKTHQKQVTLPHRPISPSFFASKTAVFAPFSFIISFLGAKKPFFAPQHPIRPAKKRPVPPLGEVSPRGLRERIAEKSGVLILAHAEEQGLEGLPVEGDQRVEVVPLPRDGDVGQEQDHDPHKPRPESPVPADGGEDQ